MLRFFSCFLFCLVFLAGCAAERQYNYKAPVAAADKACVARCMQGKSSCMRICRLKYDDCKARGGLLCKPVCSCVTSFNTCYSACGGQVSVAPFTPAA